MSGLRATLMFGASVLWAVIVQAGGPDAARSGGREHVYAAHGFLAYSQTEEVKESSGIAPSHFDADVFWTHNDSGHPPRLYAFRLAETDRRRHVAADLGYLELRGARCVDWEDLAAGPGNTLYVFDGGDNPPCERTDKRIIRLVEPKIDWTQGPVRQAVQCESARFEYPDPDRPETPATRNEHRYDAECMLVHPVTGDVYVVTKRGSRNKTTARVYRLPAASTRFDGRTVHVLEFVADLSKRAFGLGAGGMAGMVTGGAAAPDGRHAVLRTYLAAYEFALPPGLPFEAIFQERPHIINLVGEPQGEGICYARNGDLLTTSEAAVGGPRFPIFITPLATQPATTRPASPDGSPRRHGEHGEEKVE